MTIACMIGGEVMTAGPIDICKMPPRGTPNPFMNIGTWLMCVDFVPMVLINSSPSCNTGTIIPESNGDQAGTMGGVLSGTFMALVTPLTGAFNVLIDGLPANNLGMTVTLSNDTNTIGIYSVPSQTDVIAL
ncbi:PAAR-like domain-containing protein [Legionella cherrii]|uniref:Uncharacterized protein n=1 Tax=Legionella cherrii TaxID=28084 RepID=A0A0W0SB49_9GAMM|nr:PAAR-like domain-containing protein [Legionella cherrii]KTC80614.1 hypothetical protein Lche_2634 [Legionella cherrii]VEB34691.1 Uncharacterised protein [Legionella cherrii]